MDPQDERPRTEGKEAAAIPPEQTASYRSDEPHPVAADSPGRLRPGSILAGRFTILRFVARGGMGEVYEAQDQVARTHVAIKLIRPELARDPDAAERLRREVLLSRRVGHPNVCRIHEIYSELADDGAPLDFITMEFLEGETLAERLRRRGRFAIGEALPLVPQLISGLQAAHAQGIVHRDFKASNVILVTANEPRTSGAARAVITDFGIARAVESEGEPQLTGSGVLGTPEYMAPEQITGGQVGPATDVFSLGVVLYQMLTGELPFQGSTPMGSAVKRLRERPTPPRTLVPELGELWSRTILRCLEAEPGQRPTTGELLTLVDRLPVARPAGPRRVWIAAVLGLIAAATVTAVMLHRKRPPPTAAAAFHARPVLAVAGVVGPAGGDQSGLAATVALRLGQEVAAARSSVRVVSTRRVQASLASLGIGAAGPLSAEQEKRLAELLGARWILGGGLTEEPGDARRLQITLLDTSRSGAPTLLDDRVTEAGLIADTARVGQKLRSVLGISASPEEEHRAAATRPANTGAARHLAEGWALLAAEKRIAAQQAFAEASAADPGNQEAHLAQAVAWWEMGYMARARGEAQQAVDGLRAIGPGESEFAEAVLSSARGDDRQGAAILQRLSARWPDEPEVLEWLVELENAPQPVVPALKRWRDALGSQAAELRTVLQEGFVRTLAREPTAKATLEGSLKTAEALGAKWEQGEAQYLLGLFHERRPPERDALYQRAQSAFHAAGGLQKELNVQRVRIWNSQMLGQTKEMDRRFHELLATYQQNWLLRDANDLQMNIAIAAYGRGDLDAAEAAVGEAEAMVQERGLPPDPGKWVFRAAMSMLRADPARSREQLLAARATSVSQGTGDLSIDLGEGTSVSIESEAMEDCRRHAIEREADILRATDQLLEAWSALERVRGRYEQRPQDRGFALWLALSQCELLCDRGLTTEGLTCLQKLPVDQAPRLVPELELRRAQCKLVSHDFAGARAAIDRAIEQDRGGQFFFTGEAEAVRALAQAATGDRAKTISALQERLREADARGWRALAMELSLALGRVERANGRGTERLRRLERDARQRGMLRIARLAHESIGRDVLAAGR